MIDGHRAKSAARPISYSGAMARCFASHLANASVVGVDISDDYVVYAQGRAKANGLQNVGAGYTVRSVRMMGARGGFHPNRPDAPTEVRYRLRAFHSTGTEKPEPQTTAPASSVHA